MRPPVKQPPAADRVYAHVKEGVLERRYEGGALLTEGELADAVVALIHGHVSWFSDLARGEVR